MLVFQLGAVQRRIWNEGKNWINQSVESRGGGKREGGGKLGGEVILDKGRVGKGCEPYVEQVKGRQEAHKCRWNRGRPSRRGADAGSSSTRLVDETPPTEERNNVCIPRLKRPFSKIDYVTVSPTLTTKYIIFHVSSSLDLTLININERIFCEISRRNSRRDRRSSRLQLSWHVYGEKEWQRRYRRRKISRWRTRHTFVSR